MGLGVKSLKNVTITNFLHLHLQSFPGKGKDALGKFYNSTFFHHFLDRNLFELKNYSGDADDLSLNFAIIKNQYGETEVNILAIKNYYYTFSFLAFEKIWIYTSWIPYEKERILDILVQENFAPVALL